MAHEEVEDRRLAMVRALLAKAEASPFPEEAESFTAKASELIARYALDEALVWADSGDSREEPDSIDLTLEAPYLAQKAVLVDTVARTHGCRAIRVSAGRGRAIEQVTVVGFPSELRWVETLVTSLMVQLTRAMLARRPAGLTSSAAAAWRRSFIIGFAEEVGARLRADRTAAREAVDATGAGAPAGPVIAPAHTPRPSTDLVLRARAEQVDDAFTRRFPRVRQAWASTGGDRQGRDAGRHAGRDAALTRYALGRQRALGPGR